MSPSASKPFAAVAGFARLPVRAARDGSLSSLDDAVAEETPLALIVNGAPHVVMMGTPADLEDFALGFLLSEGLIESATELESLAITPLDNGVEIAVRIPEARAALLADRRRNLPGRSGCGLCGSETIAEVMRPAPRVPAGTTIAAAALARALRELREQQPINAATGATHAAAWAEVGGRVLLVREDVGRHNALDKLIGACVRERLDLARGFCVVTSRASYEMALKAATAGMPLLAAISAPTTLAVKLASDSGLTLVGYARGGNHVVYACPARLVEDAPITPAESHAA